MMAARSEPITMVISPRIAVSSFAGVVGATAIRRGASSSTVTFQLQI
jgi:hypothetical protein